MLRDDRMAGRKLRLADGLEIIDPQGAMLKPTVLAPQPRSLVGSRLGLLDNSKWNAALLLKTIGEEMGQSVSLAETRMYRKENWGQLAGTALLDQIVGESDAVITASGD